MCGMERCVPRQINRSDSKTALFAPRWPLIPINPRFILSLVENKSWAFQVVTNGILFFEQVFFSSFFE